MGMHMIATHRLFKQCRCWIKGGKECAPVGMDERIAEVPVRAFAGDTTRGSTNSRHGKRRGCSHWCVSSWMLLRAESCCHMNLIGQRGSKNFRRATGSSP